LEIDKTALEFAGLAEMVSEEGSLFAEPGGCLQFDCLADKVMQAPPVVLHQGRVGRVLDQGVLKDVGPIRVTRGADQLCLDNLRQGTFNHNSFAGG
jgi:hypothetical protein